MRTVYRGGAPLVLDPTRLIGTGGEAEVYDVGNGSAAKVWKGPDHPDFEGSPDDRASAATRIANHQKKMPAFPKHLPSDLVAPMSLLTDKSGGTIVGYEMPLVRDAAPLHSYSDPAFRRRGVSLRAVVAFFERLARTLRQLHAAGFLIGDFNDFNVLVTPQGEPRIIDADSAQFGPYLCTVFTERFVDPLLCLPDASSPQLVRPYTEGADWYAYSALLFQSIFCVGPFGGVFRPADPRRRIPHALRPLRRVSVFDQEVALPKWVLPLDILPNEWLRYFRSVFESTERDPGALATLPRLNFTVCESCHLEHATIQCPRCTRNRVLPRAKSEGALRVDSLFSTEGVVLHASAEGGHLRFVYHDQGAYRREDGTAVLQSPLDGTVHTYALPHETIVARGHELIRVTPTGIRRHAVDTVRGIPAVACNARELFWSEGGQLVKAQPSPLDPEGLVRVGDVLAGQTRFWIGPSFGIGCYRVGALVRGFTFDLRRSVIRDDLRMPPLVGDIMDATATLDGERAWLFLAINEGQRVRHRCLVYSRDGVCIATHDEVRGGEGWLGHMGGALAHAGMLFVPTDAGVVRVASDRGALRVSRTFSGTEPFVDASCRLLAGERGLMVVHSNKILLLHIKPD